jgi:hypothetical protein
MNDNRLLEILEVALAVADLQVSIQEKIVRALHMRRFDTTIACQGLRHLERTALTVGHHRQVVIGRADREQRGQS